MNTNRHEEKEVWALNGNPLEAEPSRWKRQRRDLLDF
jgi:hypothetical protein